MESEDYADSPPAAPAEPSIPPLALKVLAGAVALYLGYRFVRSLKITPPESENNRFLKKEKKVSQHSPRSPRPGQVLTASRGSQSLRAAAQKVSRLVPATVGREAQYMVDVAWAMRPPDAGYFGIEGLDDDCLHLSTAAQVVETAKLYFKGVEDVLLLKYSTEMIEKDDHAELRWEQALPPPGKPARPDAFPHVYAKEKGEKARLSWFKLVTFTPLPLGPDQECTFPPGALSEDEVLPPPTSKPSAAMSPRPLWRTSQTSATRPPSVWRPLRNSCARRRVSHRLYNTE